MNVVVKLVEWTAASGFILAGLFGQRWWMHCHRPDEPAAQPVPVPGPQQSEQAQATLDAAFEQATEQYQAGLETGQGGRMPSREQVAAQYASITEEHDRIPLTTDELLAFAALAAGFERTFRPPIAADPDSDSSPRAW